jgi:hypothetical protein
VLFIENPKLRREEEERFSRDTTRLQGGQLSESVSQFGARYERRRIHVTIHQDCHTGDPGVTIEIGAKFCRGHAVAVDDPSTPRDFCLRMGGGVGL